MAEILCDINVKGKDTIELLDDTLSLAELGLENF